MTTTEPRPIGLYLHVPFCKAKCLYCDFYSMPADAAAKDAYTAALCRAIDAADPLCDTVYFGGGTPSQLGHARLAAILSHIRRTPDCEVTVECNPGDADSLSFEALAAAGVNRLSMGLQSAEDGERRALGRRSSRADVQSAVERAQAAGLTNLSLDLMLGIPGQTAESLARSIDFCVALGVPHVSAYLLKIEDGTPFAAMRDRLALPEEDAVCDFYLQTVRQLAEAGLPQYEISNFASPGFESRHNLKYWRCEEYLGLGPAAHSFLQGRRFYYPRDLQAFLDGKPPIPDGTGGDPAEWLMLRLRLTEGVSDAAFAARFGRQLPAAFWETAARFARQGLMTLAAGRAAFTPAGCLLSNPIIGALTDTVAAEK